MQVYLREAPRALILVAAPSAGRSQQGRDGFGGTAPPRTALVLSTHNRSSNSSSSRCRAVIETVSTSDLPELVSLQKLHANAFGCLGLINVGADLFVGIINDAASVGHIRPGELAMRITSVTFHCLNMTTWDDGAPAGVLTSSGEPGYGGALDPQGPAPLPHEAGYAHPTQQNNLVEHPCTSIRKLLVNGTFYFAKDGSFDISRRLDRRVKRVASSNAKRRKAPPPPPPPHLISPLTESAPPLEASATRQGSPDVDPSSESKFDSRFVWNTYMMEPLLEYYSRLDVEEQKAFDRENLLTAVIQGFVGAFEVGGMATIALVSRLSWKRAGTRYATRGIDDDGNVANFAESETMYTYQGSTMSYCQVRGSVPLFWEQQGLQAFNARIQVVRSRVASQPAFDRHFADLLEHYKQVYALNLLGTRDAETVLTSAYAEHMRHSEAEEVYLATLSKDDTRQQDIDDDDGGDRMDRIGLTNFDFHTQTRLSGGLDGVKADLQRLGPVQLKKQSFRYSLVSQDGTLEQQQRGVFRTNCLDCLDRTNVAQDILSQDALKLCVDRAGKGGLPDAGSAVWTNHRLLWAENGDALSRIYAGTGALNSTFTRTGVGKKTLGGLLSDAAKSASRLYINNFQDKSKQNVIDALLGNMANQRPVSVFDPIHDAVKAELTDRLDEYSSPKEVSVFVGTWNLAGRGPSGESLQPFLFPTEEEPDVLAIGLQEVVPLTPSQILLTDPEKLRMWESIIADHVAKRKGTGNAAKYIPLRSEQLVGTALVVLIKDSLLPSVRQVEAATKKTGLKGMSGNKGGVAIRMNICDTSFCFVTAHFAAGKTNVDERNADFATITRELGFHSGRTIANSQHVFWFGDFNYRIDGGNEIVRPLCENGDLDELSRRDQLVRAQQARQAFVGYTEGPLVFLPTYKYDMHTQTYDTSEKMRVPAWTDRVLYKSQHPLQAHMLMYDRAELLTSDHRPVFALFQADARVYDVQRRNTIRRELLAKYRSRSGAALEAGLGGDDNDASGSSSGDDHDYDTDELPAPSRNGGPNWWDEALSSEGEEDAFAAADEHLEQQDSSDDERRDKANTFGRHRRGVQYARRRTTVYTDSSRSGPSSMRGTSPLPNTAVSSLASSAALMDSPTIITPSSADPARRPAPMPPKRTQGKVPAPERTTTSPLATTTQPGATSPPPIPSKPAHIIERPLNRSNASSTGERNTVTTNGTANPSPQQPARPRVPARPGMGSRSQSYQSQRSLLDGSD